MLCANCWMLSLSNRDDRVSFPPFSWGNGWNYFVVFNSSHSSMGCLANQRRLCPSWKWREPEPEPIEEWLELFCWLLGIAVNNLIPAIPSWKWRETDSNIPLLKTFFCRSVQNWNSIMFWISSYYKISNIICHSSQQTSLFRFLLLNIFWT